MPKEIGRSLGILTLVLACGCADVGLKRESVFARHFGLRVVVAEAARPGTAATIELALENRSVLSLSGCVVKEPTCVVRAGRNRAWKTQTLFGGAIASQPSCGAGFALQPGQLVEWSRDISLADFPPGAAILICRVQVTTGQDCGRPNRCLSSLVTATLPVEVSADPVRRVRALTPNSSHTPGRSS